MSSVDVSSGSATGSLPVKAGEMRLEVVVVPQEIKTRLPGRLRERVMATTYESVSDLVDALRRAAEAHGKHEERTGKADPDWPDWYALYVARERAGKELPT